MATFMAGVGYEKDWYQKLYKKVGKIVYFLKLMGSSHKRQLLLVHFLLYEYELLPLERYLHQKKTRKCFYFLPLGCIRRKKMTDQSF